MSGIKVRKRRGRKYGIEIMGKKVKEDTRRIEKQLNLFCGKRTEKFSMSNIN